jgi:hypothetical protein
MSPHHQNYNCTLNKLFSLSSSFPKAKAIKDLITLINNDTMLAVATNPLSNTSDSIVVDNSYKDAVLQGIGEVSESDKAKVSFEKQIIIKQSMDSVRETEKVPERSTFHFKFLTYFQEKQKG